MALVGALAARIRSTLLLATAGEKVDPCLIMRQPPPDNRLRCQPG
jgi:hypothetical protein